MTLVDQQSPVARRRPRTAIKDSNAIEVIAVAAARFARSDVVDDPRRSRFGRWCDGVATIRTQRLTYADFWRAHNERALAATGPLWVVLGDSTALGLGADHPLGGYAGQTGAWLAEHTGRPWRIVNLGVSGASTREVLDGQLPLLADLPEAPDLVTCGVGSNDILQTPPRRLHAALRSLVSAVPGNTTVLDIPQPAGCWGIGGRLSAPYIGRFNRTIHAAAARRGLPVATVSARFTAPWPGKFGPDQFHPSTLGYRDWTEALIEALPVLHA